MNTKTTISISEARKKIFNIAAEVQKPSIHYILTEKGRPKAVIMSAEEFELWQETLEAMRDFPDLKKDIRQAKRDYENGDYITLNNLLAKEGYILKDKAKEKYEISRSRARKSSKRNK